MVENERENKQLQRKCLLSPLLFTNNLSEIKEMLAKEQKREVEVVERKKV